MSRKHCVVAHLKPECVESYVEQHKTLHQGPFKELLTVIRDSGVQEEAVFIHENMIVIYFEADDLDGAYQRQAKSEIIQKWNQLMKPMFDSQFDFNKEEATLPVLAKVFDLNEQLAGELRE